VYGEELQKDVEHIQDQLTIIENFLEEVSEWIYITYIGMTVAVIVTM
jgi:hypothetical protein